MMTPAFLLPLTDASVLAEIAVSWAPVAIVVLAVVGVVGLCGLFALVAVLGRVKRARA